MISRLKQFIEEEPLPGKDQQYKLAPYMRLVESIDLEKAQPRVSAVCIILYPVNQAWHSILIERPAYEGVHSGQIAFPGGKVEEGDSGLWHTAQRETYEEVGIPIGSLGFVGKLTEVYIPPSNFIVHPYIGFLPEQPNLIPDAYEVANIIQYDVSMLLDDSIIKQRAIKHSSNTNIHTSYFDIHGNVVWGATGMVLMEFKEILRRVYKIP